MPNLFLEPYQEGGQADRSGRDIAAFLFRRWAEKFPTPATPKSEFDGTLDEFVSLFLSKAAQRGRHGPGPWRLANFRIPNRRLRETRSSWPRRTASLPTPKNGRRCGSIMSAAARSRAYGCYGCHDIPNFETARPIGTTLQDWGRKDTSRLATEHIEEYFGGESEPDGMTMRDVSSTR